MSQIRSFNANWTFALERDIAQGKAPQPVTLPHTWYTDEEYIQESGTYRKRFDLKLSEGQRAFLRFHGVDKICTVSLNGHTLGHHEGGYTIFTFELTPYLAETDNELVVIANNETGKTVSPLSGDFAVFGGIHRKVELMVTDAQCFDHTFWGTDGVIFNTGVSDGKAFLYAFSRVLNGAGRDAESGLSIRYDLADAEGQLVASRTIAVGTATQASTGSRTDGVPVVAAQGNTASLSQCASTTAQQEPPAAKDYDLILSLDDFHPWNGLDQAYLYTATATLLDEDDRELDTVTRKVGFRSFSIDVDRGFFLNAEHVKLHGVAKHQDFDKVYSAAGEKEWQRDMELISEIGANCLRLSHYPHPQRIYDLADEKGLVVWAEIPMLKLTKNEELFANAEQQLTEMILQNMHHPSIFFWGVQNEIAIWGEEPYMYEKIGRLNELVHELDLSRLSTSSNLNAVATTSPLNQITDVTAYNVYYGWYYGSFEDHGKFLDEFHRDNSRMPLGISEYGADTNLAYHSDHPRVNDYTEEFQALYHESVYPSMRDRDFVWGSFVWNMFDFVSPIRTAANIKNRNLKGLVTFDRQTRKDAFYYYKAQWRKDPVIHIAEQRFVNRCTDTMTVKVYSNQPEVTLTAGGRDYVAASSEGVFLFENIPLSIGENHMVATAGSVRDEATFLRQETADTSYVYVDQHPGLNVANWFEDEQEKARLFPEDRYSLKDSIETLRSNEKAFGIIREMMPEVAKAMEDAMGSFALDRFVSFMKPDYTEEEFMEMNARLREIEK